MRHYDRKKRRTFRARSYYGNFHRIVRAFKFDYIDTCCYGGTDRIKARLKMNEDYILERIIKDAKTEAKKIIAEAKERANGNILYARGQAARDIADAKEEAKKSSVQSVKVFMSAQEVKNRISMLEQKTRIVDQIFAEVKKEVRYNWRIIETDDFIIRFTRDEIFSCLREDIEPEVVRILFS
jgi:vacuolar-type H+-ATPase subunit H